MGDGKFVLRIYIHL